MANLQLPSVHYIRSIGAFKRIVCHTFCNMTALVCMEKTVRRERSIGIELSSYINYNHVQPYIQHYIYSSRLLFVWR